MIERELVPREVEAALVIVEAEQDHHGDRDEQIGDHDARVDPEELSLLHDPVNSSVPAHRE
jgi:hypothetical protein